MIAWAPGQIPAQKSNQLWSSWDIGPTLLDFTDAEAMKHTDGISVKDVLTGKAETIDHPYLYWEFCVSRYVYASYPCRSVESDQVYS